MRFSKFLLLSTILISSPVLAQQAASLMDPGQETMGWSFDNGREFPGAKGGLEVDESVPHNGQPSLKLTADFTGGGKYVQAARDLDGVNPRQLSFWLKGYKSKILTMRLIDASGQCHQFRLKVEPNEDWQRVVFPVEQYFENQSSASALTMVAKYESWGGEKKEKGTWKKTGKWNGPGKKIVFVLGQSEKGATDTVWLNSMTIVPGDAGGDSKPTEVATSVPLDEIIEGEHFWQFSLGQEFKGAKGSLKAVKDATIDGGSALELTGDFSDGGRYVAAMLPMDEFGMKSLKEIKLRVKSTNVDKLTIRLGDSTGQTHQAKNFQFPADGKWHDLVIDPEKVAGGEHWGGAKDGKWHGPAKYVALTLGAKEPNDEPRKVTLADINAVGTVAATVGETAWQANFEDADDQPAGWTLEGTAAAGSGDAFKGEKALVLSKTEKTLRAPVSATSPVFPVSPGAVEVKFAARTDLESMDNSYNGSLDIEFLNAGGSPVGKSELSTLFRRNNWKPVTRQVVVPEGAASARLVARINKESPGKYWLDELAVTGIQNARKDELIERMMFTTAQTGNLLFPKDSREVEIEVWTKKPLPEDQREVSVNVTDYWGAEQSQPLTTTLERAGRKDRSFIYKGKVDLGTLPLEVGRYYEMHGSIARPDAEPFTNYSSLAILPEAPANAYKPMEIPFTSRNWDNRISAYVDLTHRMGIRICGLWGRMESDPKKVQAPQIDRIAELDMAYLTGSPVQNVIRRVDGWETEYSEEKLREGVRNFFAKYGKYKPAIVNLGNEPHTKGEDVKVDVAAYKAVYQEIKKIDPNIFVVGTSVNVQEDHFKYGFGEWLDAYDFHVYEDATSVRKIVEEKFPAMFKKYGFPKPIWSTELGLNSQGMARQFVAAEVYRKFANFFAGGGANVSWFGLLYPDPKGTNGDSFGSAHNVFDCRYNKYAPKLDAIAYFNAVNNIAIKKYVADTVYGENTHAFLFRDRDDQALQIWYKDKGREDIFIPLPGVEKVRVTRIDGSLRDLDAQGKGITLTITEDPVLLMYVGGDPKLPAEIGEPAVRLGKTSDSVVRGEKSSFDVLLNTASAEQLELQAPPFWKVESETATDTEGRNVVSYSLMVPEASAVREADMTVDIKSGDKIVGQIYHRPSVTGVLHIELLPVPEANGQPPALKLVIQNNSPARQEANWDVVLTGEQKLSEGAFSPVEPTSVYFADTSSGVAEIEGKQSKEILLPLVDADLYTVYRARAVVRDGSGRATVQERPVSAFYGVPKAKVVTLDGKLDEADWKNAPVRKLDNASQFYAFKANEKKPADWSGVDDLSAEIRYLWDDESLYVSVTVRDDAPAPLMKGKELWLQDGLQFLVDPMRTSDRKSGKYDYFLGVGKSGNQAWCSLSADGDIPAGETPAIRFATTRGREGSNDITYEIAIPWANLAPFDPSKDTDLGFTLIVNEGDNEARNAFMTWFGNAHNKDIDTVGDLLLLP